MVTNDTYRRTSADVPALRPWPFVRPGDRFVGLGDEVLADTRRAVQADRNEHGYARERGRECHIQTLTRCGVKGNLQFAVCSSHGCRGGLAGLAVRDASASCYPPGDTAVRG